MRTTDSAASAARPLASAVGRWQLDLALPKASAGARVTNEAIVRGHNLAYAGVNNWWRVDIAYLDARLTDSTPDSPLSIWEPATYKTKVKAARVTMSEEQADSLIATLIWQNYKRVPFRDVKVAFLDGNQVQLKGHTFWKGLRVPVAARLRVTANASSEIRIEPRSVRVFGVPVYWAVKLLRLDVTKHVPLAPGGLLSVARNGRTTLDLAKQEQIEGQLSGLEIRNGRATLTMGGHAPASIQGARTGHNPNYAEIVARGEVALESAVLRDASVVIRDNTPQDPYAFNHWDQEGVARVESGEVILDEQRLSAKFASASPQFKVKHTRLSGNTMKVEGSYRFLEVSWPLSFKLTFGWQDGKLKITPHSARIVGISGGLDTLLDTMAEMEGATRVGKSILLDMSKAASVELPTVTGMHLEPERLVLR